MTLCGRRCQRFASGLAWIGCSVCCASCTGAPPAPTTAARGEAERLYTAAHERMLHLEVSAAVDTLAAAFRTDPTYVPALAELTWERPGPSAMAARMLDSIGHALPDRSLGHCISAVAAGMRGVRPSQPAPRTSSPEAKLCLDYLRVSQGTTRGPPRLDAARRLAAAFPASPVFTQLEVVQLENQERFAEAAARARHYASEAFPPFVRAGAYAELASTEHEMGHDDAAVATEQAAATDAAARNPGYLLWLNLNLLGHAGMRAMSSRTDPAALARHADSVQRSAEAALIVVSAKGDLVARVWARSMVASQRLDRGRIEDAVRDLTDAARVADSIGEPDVRASALTRLGRALVKRGHPIQAEQILLAARAAGDTAAMPRLQKEVEHNLLHLYESLGRFAAARTAGERFVRYASEGPFDAVRMMSERDFGMFLRARGEIAASSAHFERMLADVDSLQGEWYYAGEYRELTGDPDGARRYYERAIADGDEPMRTLEGLIRVGLAMGDMSGARTWAERHDVLRDAGGRPESAPLLPMVMARTASRAEARRSFDTARRATAGAGQVAAWAALTADLAALEIEGGAFARARSLADSATVAAASVADADVELLARSRAAYAGARSGARRGAHGSIASLEALATASDRTASPQLRAEIRRLAGASLAADGRWLDALASYRRSATTLDSVASGIAMDPDQAAYRSAQRRVYDEALALIVRHRSDGRALGAFAEWSARRKGRAYGGEIGGTLSVIARPAAGTVVIDYVLLDSVIAVAVHTSQTSQIVVLPASSRAVVTDVVLLRRAVDARVGSSVDLTHARFPLDVAHRLYDALLGPLQPLLATATTIIVVPDGILSLIPFDALVTSVPADGTDEARASFVIDRHVVIDAMSANVDPKAWRMPAGRILVVAPHAAPGGDAEVAAIHAVVPQARVLTAKGAAAGRRAVLRAITASSVLHFVTHAEANEHDPGSSDLELEPDANDDGKLRATEIGALQLHAPLVVLSACETASGVVLDGEGVLSLSRSFLRAGARATVATLWPVGPATATFATEFYRAALAGGDVARALRSAKLAMRARGTSAFAWAPFQLYAGPAPVTRDRKVAQNRTVSAAKMP